MLIFSSDLSFLYVTLFFSDTYGFQLSITFSIFRTVQKCSNVVLMPCLTHSVNVHSKKHKKTIAFHSGSHEYQRRKTTVFICSSNVFVRSSKPESQVVIHVVEFRIQII
jgi:hypothetical protein